MLLTPSRIIFVCFGLTLIGVSLMGSLLTDEIVGRWMARSALAFLGFCIALVGLVLPQNKATLFLSKVSLFVCCALVTTVLVEVAVRLSGYEARREEEAFETLPIYFRQRIVPVGSIYFRRPGPDQRRGKALSVWLRSGGWP